LAVLTTTDETTWDAALAQLREAGLPALWIPRKPDFVKVDTFPILGTGKLDLGGLRKVAQERLG
jgi:acyl-[acyl-carrier-protein]-phospholipid O-acyltransferase/long-chain-fatty-acid--[acyl-carrier-protein] ligase